MTRLTSLDPIAGSFSRALCRPLLAPLLLATGLLLGGCAAQQAYREGVRLAEAGDPEAALRHFEEAVRLDDGSSMYRMAAIYARDKLAGEHRQRFEQALAQGELDGASDIYHQHLRKAADGDKLLARLRAARSAKLHEQWKTQAEAHAAKGDQETANGMLRRILAENPQHEQAASLLAQWSQPDAAHIPGRQTSLDQAFKTPITIEFKDAPLKTVFEVISRTSGLNFVFDRDVRTDQKTSLFLRNSTVESAIRLALLTNQLEQRVLDGNSILIYPNNQAKQKDYQSLSVKVFYLANAEAKAVAASLKTILKSKDVVVDDKLNMIILRDSPEAVRLAEKIVAVHDVSEPEVMLEVEILEVNRSRLLDLGVRWPDQLSLNPIAADGTNLTLADLWSATRDRSGRTIGATIGSTSVRAQKTDSDSDILANPRIRVRNRDKARILIGDRVPNITSTSTSTGFVAESINYVDVGLKLEVEPTIYIDGEVAIKVALEVSNIVEQLATKSGTLAYRIGTRSAQTVLRLRDGENQVLAGLINNEDRTSANKVPGLGELPVAGRLFGSRLDNNNRTEIVLSITPRILRNVTRPAAHALEFESGTDANLGARLAAPVTNPKGPAATPPKSSPPPGSSAGAAPLENGDAPPAQDKPEASPANADRPAAERPQPVGGVVQVRWEAPAQVSRSQPFTVQLALQSDAPVMSVPVSLGFDASTVQVVSVEEGTLLRQGGSSSSFVHRVDPSGQILMTATRANAGNGGSNSEAGHTGTVASVTFRVTNPTVTETQLRVLAMAPVGQGGKALSTALPGAQTLTINP